MHVCFQLYKSVRELCRTRLFEIVFKVLNWFYNLLKALTAPDTVVGSIQKMFKATDISIKIVSNFFAQISFDNFSEDIFITRIYADLYGILVFIIFVILLL